MSLRLDRKLMALSVCTLVASGALFFQNCSEFVPLEMGSTVQLSGVMLKNCLSSTDYDACVFYKNPSNTETSIVDSGGALLLPSERNQAYAVRLTLGSNRQELVSDNLTAMSFDGSIVRSSTWMIGLDQDASNVVPALMSFYWAQSALELFERTKAINLANARFKIVTDAAFTGWSSDESAIFLEAGSLSRIDAALDGSVVTHLVTEAVISHVTAKSIYDMTGDTSHLDCGPLEGPVLKSDCCSSKLGCSRALTAGLSDYFSSVIFQGSPAVGDYVSGKVSGADVCGISRNPVANANLTFPSAHAACADSGRSGQIFNMGAVLSSALFSVRKGLSPDDAVKFDALVTATLPYLSGSTTFAAWKARALALDASNYGGRFGPVIDAEFNRRSF